MHDVIVIGGGIAGLTCAWQLRKAGAKTLLLERLPRPGGNVRTENDQGFLVEQGPHSFPGYSSHVWRLLVELDLESEVIAARPEASKRFVYRDGKLHVIPRGPFSFLATDLLSLRGKARLLMEPFVRGRPQIDDSAEQFFIRRFGAEATRYLAVPFVSGVYAGDVAQLEARAAFPLFWRFEQESGSMILGACKYFWRRARKKDTLDPAGPPTRNALYSFRSGLGRLVERISKIVGDAIVCDCAAQRIARHGGQWRVESPRGTWMADELVIAVPPPEAARLLEELWPEIAQQLREIVMAPVAVVHLGFDQETEKVPAGFGFLIPRHYGMRSLGTVFTSRLFDARAPEGVQLLSTFVGGILDPHAIQKSDAELEAIVRQDLTCILGIEATPCYRRILRHPCAIPQFTRGHLERITYVRQHLAAHPDLVLAGNYLTGVAMNEAVHSGYAAAANILNEQTANFADPYSLQKVTLGEVSAEL